MEEKNLCCALGNVTDSQNKNLKNRKTEKDVGKQNAKKKIWFHQRAIYFNKLNKFIDIDADVDLFQKMLML